MNRNTQDKPHKQVIARVGCYVDERIKELVELLNTFYKINTFESCQGREGKALAFVYMNYGDCDTAYDDS